MPTGELLALRGIKVSVDGEAVLGPIDWDILGRERILLDCPQGRPYEALLDLFAGQAKITEGYIEEIESVSFQSDANLSRSIDPNRTFHESLQAPPLPDTLWLNHKRCTLWVVVDRLELSQRHFALPLKLEPPGVTEKLLALRFIASQADLLLGRDIFMSEDPAIRAVLAQRWNDFSGTVICAAPESHLPGPVDSRVTVTEQGHFHVARVNRDGEVASEPVGHPEDGGEDSARSGKS